MLAKHLFCGCLLFILADGMPALAANLPTTGTGQDLSISQAVETALANNLNLRLQREEVNSATGAEQIAQGTFDTTLSASLQAESSEASLFTQGYVGSDESASLQGSLEKQFITGTQVELSLNNSRFDYVDTGRFADPAYNATLSLGISQPLLKGFGKDIQTAEIEAAKKSLAAASFAVDSLAADLAAQVKAAYWDLVYAWQDIEVKRLSLTLASKLLEETDAKIKAGKLADVDIYQPQSEVARREEFLIGAERAIGVAEDDLKLLMNTVQWATALNPTDQPVTDPRHPDPEQILTEALNNRPDLKAADLAAEAASLKQRIATDNTRPNLALAGSVGYGGSETDYGKTFDAALDDPQTNWQIGLEFSMPLDNTAAKGSLLQAKADYNSAKTSAELLRLQTQKKVRTTVRDVELAIKAIEATHKTSLASAKRLEAEQAKFAAGRATTLDVLTAQDAYSQALSLENQSRIAYVKVLAELDRIQGKISLHAGY